MLGGVKTVSEIYVGVGGSPKKVWPSYTDYGDEPVVGTDIKFGSSYGYSVNSNCGTTSSYNARGTSSNWTNRSGSSYACIWHTGGGLASNIYFSTQHNFHWINIGPMDTRGYNYLSVRFCADTWTGLENIYFIAAIGYNSTATNNPIYGGHYTAETSSGYYFGQTSTGVDRHVGPHNYLFDITNMNEENTYVQIGGMIYNTSDEDKSYYHTALNTSGDIKFYKSYPSDFDPVKTLKF